MTDSNELIKLRREEVIEKISKWLRDSGYEIKESSDPQITAKNYYYVNILALGNKCSVYFPGSKPDNLIIDTDMFLKEEDYNLLRTQKRHIQNRFIFDLQAALLQMPSVRHNVLYDEKGTFARLKVYKEIYFDGLTKHMFMTSIGDIAEGVMLCLIKFGQFRDSLWPEGAGKSNPYNE